MDRLLSMRVFQQVADEGSFAAASRSLDLSPPVVTRLVADLEAHLGTRLLQRSTRRLALTEEGQMYLHRIRNILQDIEEADAITSAHAGALAGRLRVHTPAVLATAVLSPALPSFRQAYPDIQIDIDVETVAEPPVEEYDITLLGVDSSFDADIVARKIIDSEMILVAAPDYLARRGTPQQPQDLVAHDGLMFKSPSLSQLSSRYLRMWPTDQPDRVQDVAIRPVLWANHGDTIRHAVLQGLGIAATSIELSAPHLASGELVRVLSPWVLGSATLYAALPSRKFIPERTRLFLDHLTTHTQALQAQAMASLRCETPAPKKKKAKGQRLLSKS